jgi:hypothetical protein
VHHFSDDTNFLFSSKNLKEITKKLNSDLSLLYEWLCANRLSLNVAKTEFIIFRPPRKNLPERVVLKLNRTKNFESPKIKYLGLILDTRLSWKHQVNELSKKLNRAVGMLYKIRENCSHEVLRSLYFSLFNSYLLYGITVWGNCSDSLINKLNLIKKKVVRAITFADFNAPSKPILKKLEILNISDLLKHQTASFMWDYDHGILPSSLSKLFTRRDAIHNRNLRNANCGQLYTAKFYKNRYGYNSFAHNGAILFNEIKGYPFYSSSSSKSLFLHKLKIELLNKY